MSKFIEISGEDGDYGAMLFEQENEVTINDIYNEMIEKGVTFLEKEINDETYYFQLKEFKDVDSDFVSYVFNEFVDYDTLKGKDLIRVE